MRLVGRLKVCFLHCHAQRLAYLGALPAPPTTRVNAPAAIWYGCALRLAKDSEAFRRARWNPVAASSAATRIALGLMLVTRPWSRWLDGRPPSIVSARRSSRRSSRALLAPARSAAALATVARHSAAARRGGLRSDGASQRAPRGGGVGGGGACARGTRWSSFLVPALGVFGAERRPPRHCITPSSSSLPHLALAAATAVVVA